MNVNALGVNLKVEKVGEGMPLILLHGYSVDSEIMKGFIEPIFQSRSDFKRIYIDTPGHGGSDYPENARTSDDLLDILIDGIQQLVGDTPFVLAGLSYGGYLARGVAFRLKKQVQGLFLICPVIKAYNRDLPSHQVIMDDHYYDYPQGFREIAVVQTETVWQRYQVEIVPGVEKFDQRLNDSELFLKNLAYSFEEEMMETKFEQPALIINGRQDSLVGYRDVLLMLESLPHATYAILDHAGHLVEIEQEKVVTSLIEEWLARVIYHSEKVKA